MNRFLLVGVAVATTSAAFAQVVNGGFESGDFTGWTTQPASSGSWFFVRSTGAHSGSFSVAFGGYGGISDEIFQSVSATNGGSYVLSFWLNNLNQLGDDKMTVSWEGQSLFDASAPVGWTQYSFNVTAHSATPEVRIAGFDGIDFSYVDDVSLTAVPEPASMAVLGTGALALLRRRRS